MFLSALLILSGCKGEAPAVTGGPEYVDVFGDKPPESHTSASAVVPEEASVQTEEADAAETESVPASPREPDYDAFTERLEKTKENYGITGLSVAIFRDGEIVHTQSMGYADEENKLPCTENTRFRIASVSKLISSMVTMTLYDKGIISPGTALSDVCDIEYDAAGSSQKVCLWHLLTHTAGIIDTYEYDSVAVTTRASVNALLANAHSGSVPGTVYSYSNFGAGTIGALIEQLTGEYFYEYADKALFKPLGMDAGYLIDKITDKESCAKLYDRDGEIFDVKNWGRKAAYYDSFGLGNSYYLAQCELIITASDLARLGMALTDGGVVDGVRVLSEEAVGLINKSYFSAPNFDMGLSVRIYDDVIDGRKIYGHPGNALGVITGLFYDPSDRTGVVLLTNRCMDAVDENGFYKANKAVLTAAYEFIL